MKRNTFTRFNPLVVGLLAALGYAVAEAPAVVLLDDTWADASRHEQNLPAESEWFCSGGSANLTNLAAGSMTLIAHPTSSRSAVTYFAANGLPVSLGESETIKVTLIFSATGVIQNDAQSMRFGLVDYSAGSRVDADNGSSGLNGANVTGYGFFGHISHPWQREMLDIKQRTGLTNGDLLGSSGAWTSVAEGWANTPYNGIVDGVTYTQTFSVTRSGSDAIVTNTLAGGELDVEVVGTTSPGNFSFDAFAFRNSGADETATSFTFTRILVEGPTPSANPPSIVTHPQDLTRTLGQNADFTVAASGASPMFYQWFYTTNSTDTLLTGETNDLLTVVNVGYDDAGGFFAVASNAIGTATSDVATLTVKAPEPTAPGLILDDSFDDGDRLTGPISESNSLWYASSAGSLIPLTGSMLGTNITSSRLWVGYFVENTAIPVDLGVGRAIKATLNFTPTGVAPTDVGTDRGLRIGLFDYADGGTRLTSDSFSSSGGNGANVLGYMLNVCGYGTLPVDTPIEIRARSTTADPNLIGTTSIYEELVEGPGGLEGQPGFQSGVPYTLEYMVTRTGLSEVEISCHIHGAGLDWALSVVDSVYAVNRFDAIGIRSAGQQYTAKGFTFTNFKVEVVEAAIPAMITAAEATAPDSFTLTWDAVSGQTYRVEHAGDLPADDWTGFVPDIVAGGSSESYTDTTAGGADSRAYRIVVP